LQIDKYLGNSLSERALLVEFLTCESPSEIVESLTEWRIPISHFDLTLGTAVNVALARPNSKPISDGVIKIKHPSIDELHKGDVVFFSGSPGFHFETKFKGKVEAVNRQSESVIVAYNPEHHTRDFKLNEIFIQDSSIEEDEELSL